MAVVLCTMSENHLVHLLKYNRYIYAFRVQEVFYFMAQ
jgi:hypothetical protein